MRVKSLCCYICFTKTEIFTFFDILFVFLSFGSFLVDIATDAAVIYQYYKNGHFIWMILTSSLVCLPSLIVQTFSFRWYVVDEKTTRGLAVIHILQLGLFYRFIELLQLGFELRRTKSKLSLQHFNQQQSDICMLRLFESFTESAPQLVLQLYIMITTEEWNLWTGISVIASIISLSWGIAAYNRAMRNVRPEKHQLSWWGLLFQALWRIGMVSSRIIALVLFAVSYGYWLITFLSVHWFCMTIWIFLQKTDFCSTWWEERLYNCVVGVIYCFCFFNLKEGRSRNRMSFYYLLTIAQNISFVVLFYFTDLSYHPLKYHFIFLVPVGMLVGLISMLLYYRFFHPSGPITFFSKKISDRKMDIGLPNKRERCYSNCTLKTSRKLTSDSIPKIPDSSILQTSISNNSTVINTSSVVIHCDNFQEENFNLEMCHLRRYHSFNCAVNNFNSEISHSPLHLFLANHYQDLIVSPTIRHEKNYYSTPNLELCIEDQNITENFNYL